MRRTCYLVPMKTITITEAKRSPGQYQMPSVISGEEEGDDWPVFEAVDGGPVDGALNHDRYIYDEN